MTIPDGVLINSGTVAAVVYGFNGTVTAGQTFIAAGSAAVGQQATAVTLAAFIASAQAALDASDKTMLRIAEGVALGATSWTAADVVAWVAYRRALRTLLTATVVSALPARPAYPAGT